MRQLFFLCFSILLPNIAAVGQTPQPDSVFVQAAKNRVIHQYEQAMGTQEHVYEGNEYIAHDHRIKIHPFYPVDSLLTGTITYNDVHYHDVPMLYDVVRDQVAVQPPEGGYRIQLRTDKIKAFFAWSAPVCPALWRQHDRCDRWLLRIPVQWTRPGAGPAHQNDTRRYFQRLLQSRLPGWRPLFVRKEGNVHEVKTKRSLLTLFPDQSRELRKYLRTNHLKFNNEQREAAITQATKHYDELTH